MQGSAEWHATILRRWHPSLLRFAVTRDNADQLAVFAIANEIDGLGRHHRDRPDFEFFRKRVRNYARRFFCRAMLPRRPCGNTLHKSTMSG